jgi:LPXTG-motif cell wall-anchored protein
MAGKAGMSSKKAVATVVLTMTAALAPATAAFAAAPAACDAYSHKCTHVEGTKIVKHPAVEGNSASLPFTGAEVVLMSVVGLGALGAGTVFVVAGRRRKAPQPA